MYYYIAETPTTKHHQDIINNIRSRFVPEGIAGEFVFRNASAPVDELVATALNQGFSTIVAIGGDGLVDEIAGSMYDQHAALGYIPLTKSPLTKLFGYDNWQSAISALRHRKLALFDLGSVNGEHYFLNRIDITSKKDCQFAMHMGRFNATITTDKISVQMPSGDASFDIQGVINFVVYRKNMGSWASSLFGGGSTQEIDSLLRAEQAAIQSSDVAEVILNGKSICTTPVSIEIIPQSVRIVVARQMRNT